MVKDCGLCTLRIFNVVFEGELKYPPNKMDTFSHQFNTSSTSF